jgi:hypothetical protein
MHNSYVWSVQHVEVQNTNGISIIEMSMCLNDDREKKKVEMRPLLLYEEDNQSGAQFFRL